MSRVIPFVRRRYAVIVQSKRGIWSHYGQSYRFGQALAIRDRRAPEALETRIIVEDSEVSDRFWVTMHADNAECCALCHELREDYPIWFALVRSSQRTNGSVKNGFTDPLTERHDHGPLA